MGGQSTKQAETPSGWPIVSESFQPQGVLQKNSDNAQIFCANRSHAQRFRYMYEWTASKRAWGPPNWDNEEKNWLKEVVAYLDLPGCLDPNNGSIMVRFDEMEMNVERQNMERHLFVDNIYLSQPGMFGFIRRAIGQTMAFRICDSVGGNNGHCHHNADHPRVDIQIHN